MGKALLIDNKKVMEEWDYEKNKDLNPENIPCYSKTKAWWKCKNGHSWLASVLSRTKEGYRGCPYCTNKKILIGENDLFTTMPELKDEWNYKKNKDVLPTELTEGSNKKVWWRCKHGHEWITSPNSRKKTGCPYCAGQKVLKGYNDLATTNPELIEEWDFEKNTIKPDEIISGTVKKVWWKCKNNHSFEATVVNRVKGRGCPYCSNKKLLKGFNDLATTNPELAKEWDFEKNSIKPDEIIAGTPKKVWWKCERGHEWFASIVSRKQNHFCPICNSSRSTSASEKAIAYYLNKANINVIENYKIDKKELDIFIPSMNIGIEYDGQYFHKNTKKDLAKNKLCEKLNIKLIRIREPKLPELNSSSIDFRISKLTHDHSYLNEPIKQLLEYLKINNIDVDAERDYNEIYLLYQKGEKKDSIFSEFPELMREWDFEKNNDLNPDTISKGMHINVWWKCSKCGYSWKAAVYSRTAGSGCPKCAGRLEVKKQQVLKIGENDFQTEYPELAKEWDYDKNTVKPNELTSGTNKKVWWRCEKNHSYEASIVNRVKGTGCPYCSNRKILKGFNDLATTNPELLNKWDYQQNTIKPQEVFAGSGKDIWWKCEKCGHVYERKVFYQVSQNGKCPKCKQ